MKRLRPYESLYHQLQYKALLGNRDFYISYNDFVKITRRGCKCHYCHAAVFWTKFNVVKHGSAANLDRKNNKIGYTLKNIVVCCRRCNLGKGPLFSYREWRLMTRCFRNKIIKPTIFRAGWDTEQS